MAANNGLNLAAGIDLSQFQKDLQYLNKQLKTAAGQEIVLNLKLDGANIKKSLSAEFAEAKKELRKAKDEISSIQFFRNGQLVDLSELKNALAAVKEFRKEYLTAVKSGDQITANARANDILKLQTFVQKLGKMSDVMAKSGLSTSTKPQAAFRAERAEVDKEIKSLERRKKLLAADTNMSAISHLREELAINKQLERLYEKKAKTYSSGRSKSTDKAINDLRLQSAELRKQVESEQAISKAINHNNALFNEKAGILSRLRHIASSYINIFAMVRLGQKIIEITGYFDQQRVALEGIVGSAEKANSLMNKIKNFALQSPRTTQELVGYTKQLSAYAIPYDELFETTKRLADLSTGLGVDMQRLILAYGQVRSAAVLRGQELRQFTEAGIPMVDELAKKFTKLNGTLVTTGEVFELISKRQVSFEMVKSVIEDMTNEGGKFYKMQENIVGTLYGQVQRLGDMLTLSFNKLGQSSNHTLMFIVKALQQVAKNIQPIISGGITYGIIKMASNLPRAFNELAQRITATNAKMLEMKKSIIDMELHIKRISNLRFVKPETIAAANKQLSSMRRQMMLLKIANWGAIIGAAAGIAISAFMALTQKSREFKQTLSDIDAASEKDTKKLTDGLDSLLTKLSAVNKGTKDYNNALETLKTNYGDYINEDLIDALVQERKALGETTESWGGLRDMIIASIKAKKEWDRHNLRSEAAGDAAIKTLTEEGNFWKSGMLVRILNTAFNNNGHSEEESSIKVLQNALEDFINNGLTIRFDANGEQYVSPVDDLLESLKKNQRIYGDEGSKYIATDFGADRIFEVISTFNEVKTWLNEQKILASNIRQRYERRFIRAEKAANEAYEGRWTGDEASRRVVSSESIEYSPFTWKKAANEEYVKAIKDNITLFNTEISEAYRNADEATKKNIIKNKELFDASIDRLNSEFSAINGNDVEQSTRIVKEINKLLGTIADPVYRDILAGLQTRFTNLAGTITGVSRTISQNIHDNFGAGSNYSVDQKDFFRLYDPTEQTLESNRNSLRELYRKNIEIIESHSSDSVWNETIKRLKQQNRWIKILAGKQYYDIVDLEKVSGNGRTPREFPEWVNIFKDAYDLYKRAITEGGTQRGVAKVLTDNTVQELYGDFFKNPGAVKEFGFKIGNKTVGEIIQENLIEGGLEDGIVDFRKAATATAKEMIAYGKASEETRGHFIKAGEQLLKWVSDTFADDSIKTWIDELSRSLENLTVDFQSRKSDIELYRQLINNGTASQLGIKVPGVTDERDVIRPESSNIRSYIMQIIGEYNSSLRSLSNESGIEYSPYQIGDIGSLDGISRVMRELTDTKNMNNNAFTATKEGKVVMDRLIKALGELDKTMRDEMKKLSGMSATGNTLNDALINAGIKAGSSQISNEAVQAIAKALGVSPDQVAASARAKAASGSANDMLKAFLDSNQFDALFSAYRKPIDSNDYVGRARELAEGLPDAEKRALENRLDKLERDIEAFNAARGDFAPFFNGLTDYRTADSRAQSEWEKLSTDTKAIGAGATFNAETNMFDTTNVTDPETLAYINLLNQKLEEIGANGIKLAKVFKDQALNNVKAFCTTAQSSLDAMSGVVKNLVSSVQAVVKAFSKAYDVMNDGENPKWMQDTEAFLGDFAENFEALIAPMAAVIALIIAITVAITVCEAVATPLLIVMAAVVAAAAILAAIIAAFQQHDRNLEHSIEDLKEDVEAFDRAITNLQAAAERSVGFEKLRKNIAATGKELEKATAYAEMARLEKEKKNTDDDKVKEYEQSAQESLDEFLNNLRDVRDELANATEDWADQMGSAIRSAFQNGENAARAFRNTVKTMIGDVIENMLQMAILEPLIESALENWTNSDYLRQKYTKEWTEKDENGNTIKRSSFDQDNYLKELLQNIGDPDKAENFYQSMLMIGDTLIDTVNGMPSVLQDFYKHNSELGTLSGGIESVTEDTARRIEALENSQLGEVFAIRTLLEQYLGNSGGFGDSTMASVQAAVVSIASDTSVISRIMQSFENQLNELRTGPSRPIHVTMV